MTGTLQAVKHNTGAKGHNLGQESNHPGQWFPRSSIPVWLWKHSQYCSFLSKLHSETYRQPTKQERRHNNINNNPWNNHFVLNRSICKAETLESRKGFCFLPSCGYWAHVPLLCGCCSLSLHNHKASARRRKTIREGIRRDWKVVTWWYGGGTASCPSPQPGSGLFYTSVRQHVL